MNFASVQESGQPGSYVGSEGRTALSRMDYGQALGVATGVVKGFRDHQAAKAKAAAQAADAEGIVNVFTEALGDNGAWSSSQAEALAEDMARKIEAETGEPVSAEQRQGLLAGAKRSYRTSDAAEREPSAARRLQRRAVIEARRAVVDNPSLAPEYRAMAYGATGIAARLAASEDEGIAETPAEKQARELREAQETKLLTGPLLERNPEIRGLAPEQAFALLREKGELLAFENTARARTENERLRNEKEIGGTVTYAQGIGNFKQAIPGIITHHAQKWERDRQTMTPDEFRRSVQLDMAQMEASLGAAYVPLIGEVETRTQMGPLYRMRDAYIGSLETGLDAKAAGERVKLIQSAAYQRVLAVNPAFAEQEVVATIIHNLGPSTQRDISEQMMNTPEMQSLVEFLGFAKLGGAPGQPSPTAPFTAQQGRVAADNTGRILGNLMTGTGLDEYGQTGTAKWVSARLTDPRLIGADTGVKTAVTSALLTELAKPEARGLIQSPAFQRYALPDVQDALVEFDRNLDNTVAQAQSELGGANAALVEGPDGVILFTGSNPRLGAVNARISQLVRAKAAIEGITPAQASLAYWRSKGVQEAIE